MLRQPYCLPTMVLVMKPPGGESHDLFGAEFKGSPCHHRVLKPPGGGSSDIFNAATMEEVTPRRVKNYNQSSIFTEQSRTNGEAACPAPAARSKSGNDSFDHLFGESASDCPRSVPKDRLRSCIVFSEAETPSTPTTPCSRKNSATRLRNPVTGSGMESTDMLTPSSRRSARVSGGNPVTGEGYEHHHHVPEKEPTPQRSSSARVPPGGFSSQLW